MKIFSIILFSIFTATVFADNLDTQLQNNIQQFLTQNKDSSHLSGVQLSVLLPNESKPRDYVVGTQRFGKSPLTTTHMMMQWGSITKEYTSMLIFKLANNGDFKVTDTIGKVLPGHFQKNALNPWPQSWKNITLIQLMNMTSGISPNDMPVNFDPQKYYSMESLVKAAAQASNGGCTRSQGCFPAGTGYFYSNTNYIILGLVVEHYTGLSFRQAINQYIFNPFREKENVYVHYSPRNNNSEIIKNMIDGYYYNYFSLPFFPQKQWVDTTNDNLSLYASAGALVGNMDTLVKLTNAFYHNQLVDPVFSPTPVTASELEQNAVQTSNGKSVTNIKNQCQNAGACYAMGLGLYYNASQGGKIWWYQGATFSYNTWYFYFSNEKIIIAISQSDDPALSDPQNNNDLYTLINNTIYPEIRAYLHLSVTKTEKTT